MVYLLQATKVILNFLISISIVRNPQLREYKKSIEVCIFWRGYNCHTPYSDATIELMVLLYLEIVLILHLFEQPY